MVANILAGPLSELAPTLVDLLRPGGQLVLAGLLTEQAPALIDAYAPDVSLSVAGEQAGWAMLAGSRRPGSLPGRAVTDACCADPRADPSETILEKPLA